MNHSAASAASWMARVCPSGLSSPQHASSNGSSASAPGAIATGQWMQTRRHGNCTRVSFAQIRGLHTRTLGRDPQISIRPLMGDRNNVDSWPNSHGRRQELQSSSSESADCQIRSIACRGSSPSMQGTNLPQVPGSALTAVLERDDRERRRGLTVLTLGPAQAAATGRDDGRRARGGDGMDGMAGQDSISSLSIAGWPPTFSCRAW